MGGTKAIMLETPHFSKLKWRGRKEKKEKKKKRMILYFLAGRKVVI